MLSFILYGLLTFIAVEVQGQDPISLPTNEEVLADETARLVGQWLDDDGRLKPDSAAVIPQPVYLDMDAPVRVRTRIENRLLEYGLRLAAEPDGYHSLRIEWDSENILILKRRGASRRTLRTDLFFTWLDPASEIQKTWNSSFVWEDDVPTDQVSMVAGAWDPASFHQKTDTRHSSFFRRIAEPAVITGAVAVTIYLLYNVRS
ncbi:MAG: hypothetical protein R6U28_05915 [Cyclonatronaceae bacterium]